MEACEREANVRRRDVRLESLCLLSLLLAFPPESASGEGESLVGLYRETVEGRPLTTLDALYSTHNDLTQCLSRLTIKYQVLKTALADSNSTTVVNAAYRKTVYDLSQVCASILTRLAISIYPADPAAPDVLGGMSDAWPPPNAEPDTIREYLERARARWNSEVVTPFLRDLKVRKLANELMHAAANLWEIVLIIYTQQLVTHDLPPEIAAATECRYEPLADAQITEECARKLHADVLTLAQLQEQLAENVNQTSTTLDAVESQTAGATLQTERAVTSLANAANSSSSSWPFTGAAFGAAVGTVLGVIGGPPGMVLGATAGGALGGGAGKALRSRQLSMIQAARDTLNKQPPPPSPRHSDGPLTHRRTPSSPSIKYALTPASSESETRTNDHGHHNILLGHQSLPIRAFLKSP